jgi:hypothetical protein
MARPIRGIANNAASAVSSGIAYAHVAHVSMSARLRFGIASARFHARSWCGAPATTSPRRFADAIEVVIAQTTQGRGILGVVDRQSARASRRPPTSRSASAPARARLQALRTHRARRRYSATKRPTDLAIGPFPTQTTATCRKTRKPTDLAKPPETTCKWPRFKHDDCTTENRGVPGSSPGLAMPAGVQALFAADRGVCNIGR